MAKTKGPLLSLDAHGSIGHALTYSHRKSGKQVRAYNKPLVAPSAKQRGQRRLTEFLVAQWQNMSAGDKATWETNARLSGPHITGYHFFLREAQRDLYLHHGLCSYWHCNEIVGGKVLDLSGNANHGTLEPGYPANAPVLVDSYKTKFSKGLLYDGIDEYVRIPHSPSLIMTNKITVIAWFKPTVEDIATSQIIIGKQDFAGSDYFYGFKKEAIGDYSRFQISIGDVKKSVAGGVLTDITHYYCLVGTYDGARHKIYQDNVLINDNPETGMLDSGTDDLLIGTETRSGFYCGGVIDEICIYNRALSAAELTTRYKFTRP